jgi:hypothetical protein
MNTEANAHERTDLTIELVHLARATIRIKEPIMIPGTPLGTRAIVEVLEASYEGERMRARLKGSAAADWLLVGPDGTASLDVRLTIETDDGALIYVSYRGRSDASEGIGAAPIYSTPLFETGDGRYAWLNKVQAVAKGVLEGDVLTYEIHEVR